MIRVSTILRLVSRSLPKLAPIPRRSIAQQNESRVLRRPEFDLAKDLASVDSGEVFNALIERLQWSCNGFSRFPK